MTSPLRDADRVLAHSYADEVYVRPTYETFQMTPREQFVDAIGCAAQMAGILIGAVVVWLTIFGLFALAVK